MARKPAVVNPNPSNTVNTLPAVPAPTVADNTTPNKTPTTSADPADLTNEAPEEKAEEKAPLPAARFDIIAYMYGFIGGAPTREGGFSTLLGRALDVRLGRAAKDEASRAAEVNAILRAGYKSAQSIRIEAEEAPFTMTPSEVVTFQTLVVELSEEKGAGKTARTVAGVGRRIAAAEKAVTRAIKSTGMSAGAIREQGGAIAASILKVDSTVEGQRAFLRSFRA